ncbi:MAG: GAF domain-containing protein, partial [Opitutales bacterium]
LVDSLYRISRLTSETDDVRQALWVVVDALFRLLPASSASIGLIDPDTNRLSIEVHRGLPAECVQTRLAPGEGITGQVALRGEPLLVGDVASEPNYVAVREGVRCEMAAPMVVRNLSSAEIEGTVVGVVNVDAEAPMAFNETDLKLLTVLTNEATRVVARLWHIRQLREKTTQLETLIGAGRQLVRKREAANVLAALAEDARRLVRCRRCAIFVLEPQNGELRLQTITGPGATPAPGEAAISLEDSALGVAVRRRKQVDVLDLAYTEEHHFVRLVQEDGLKSMLATPIVYEREVLGVLNVYTETRHRFSNDERRLLQSLASLGASALQNAHLYGRVFASEEAVRKNERLTTLGMLSAEIAHEIRNPLTVIKLLFDSLELEFGDGDPRNQDVAVIAERLNHLEEIVGRVLEFGRSRTGMHSRYNLAALIDETLLLVRPKLEQSNIQATVEHVDKDLTVNAHKGQIQQVLLNLTMNALQAMPEGGTLLLRTFAGEGSARVPRAVVEIVDTGTGVPEHLRGRIFESFLTGRSEGTGLGLAISKQIMKAHRGSLDLIETGPAGTRFRFFLPAVTSD